MQRFRGYCPTPEPCSRLYLDVPSSLVLQITLFVNGSIRDSSSEDTHVGCSWLGLATHTYVVVVVFTIININVHEKTLIRYILGLMRDRERLGHHLGDLVTSLASLPRPCSPAFLAIATLENDTINVNE